MIGVFDSGIGGLTVLKTLAEKFPAESFLYLGDLARLPYGSKSPDTIRKYSEQNVRFLISQNVKCVVIACNSASTQMREDVFEGIPVLNVIEPGAETALKVSQTKKIGVLGTRATISSGAYEKELLKLDPDVQVTSVACPLLVPLAEEGWIDDPVTNLIAYRYLHPFMNHQVDTLILGCTHYPILKSSIARAVGNSVTLVESGDAVAAKLTERMNSGEIIKDTSPIQTIEVFTTDAPGHFKKMATDLLAPKNIKNFSVVNV